MVTAFFPVTSILMGRKRGKESGRPSKSAPLTARLSMALPRLAEFRDIAAFQNLQMHAAKEHSKLKLSRMSFFRDAIRIRGSVLPRILPSVLGVTLWAALIFTADYYFARKWKTSSAIVGPLSVVVGLLLVFRNSTSYDRWYEARKLWASATSDCRSLARYLWANVDVRSVVEARGLNSRGPDASTPSVYGTAKTHTAASTTTSKSTTDENSNSNDGNSATLRALEKKRSAIRLLILFQYALAHELRGEPGVEWEDYEGILPDEMRELWDNAEVASIRWGRSTAADLTSRGKRATAAAAGAGAFGTLRELAPEEVGGNADGDHDGDVEAQQEDGSETRDGDRHRPANWLDELRGPRGERAPLLPQTQRVGMDTTARPTSPSANLTRKSPPPAMGLPLFALYELGRYVASARKAGLLNDIGPAGFSLANSQLASLTTAHAALTRIADCTIPVIYGIHLKQCKQTGRVLAVADSMLTRRTSLSPGTMFYLLALPLTLVTERESERPVAWEGLRTDAVPRCPSLASRMEDGAVCDACGGDP